MHVTACDHDIHAPADCERNIDCVFIVDESGSVRRHNYDIAKQFVENVVSFFSIGRQQTRVGYISYSSGTRTAFNLNTHTTLPALQRAIRSVRYHGGLTYTAAALHAAKNMLTPSRGLGARADSEGIPKIAILLTGDPYCSQLEFFMVSKSKKLFNPFHERCGLI